MSKLSQGVPAQGATHPPCPEWCEHHWDSDEDVRQGVETSIYRHHTSKRRMPYRCVDGRCGHRHEVVVSVRRRDGDHAVGETVIAVGGLCPGDALSVEDAGRLASILRHAELAARAERPEGNTGEDDPSGRGVGLRQCERCGHWFHPKGSPDMNLCWVCGDTEAPVTYTEC
jgi:hypothetical protein